MSAARAAIAGALAGSVLLVVLGAATGLHASGIAAGREREAVVAVALAAGMAVAFAGAAAWPRGASLLAWLGRGAVTLLGGAAWLLAGAYALDLAVVRPLALSGGGAAAVVAAVGAAGAVASFRLRR